MKRTVEDRTRTVWPRGLLGAAAAVLAAAGSGWAGPVEASGSGRGTEGNGFIDAHVHFHSFRTGAPGSRPDPGPTNPLDRVAGWMASNPPGEPGFLRLYEVNLLGPGEGGPAAADPARTQGEVNEQW